MGTFLWRSLKTRVTLFTLVIFVLGIWSLTFYTSRLLRADLQTLLGAQQFTTVSMVAKHIEQELENRLQSLEMVTHRISPAMMTHPDALKILLDEHVVTQSMFSSGLFVLGPDGTAMAETTTGGGRVGHNFLSRDDVTAALKQGKAAIGLPHFDKVKKNPEFGTTVPIRNPAGQVIGALHGEIDLVSANFLDEINADRNDQASRYLLVARAPRMVIITSGSKRVMDPVIAAGKNPYVDRFMQGFEGTVVFNDPFNIEMLTSVKGVAAANWYVAMNLPSAEAFAPIHALQQRLLWAATLVTLLAAGLTWWLLRRELAPLMTVATTLAALPDTGPFPNALPITRQDEIGHLIGGFNHLLASLQQRETLRKQAEANIIESEERYRALIEESPTAIVVHAQNKLLYANPAAIKLIGATSAQDLIGQPVLERIHPDYRQAVLASVNNGSAIGTTAPFTEEKFLKLDGSIIDVEVHSTKIIFDGHAAFRTAFRDITERKLAQEKLQLAASVFSHAHEAITIADVQANIIDVNQAFCQITGYSRAEVLGRNPRFMRSERQSVEFYACMWRELNAKGQWSGEVWNRRKNGEIYPVMLTISAVRNGQGEIQHYVSLFSDITIIKAHQHDLEHSAHFDALTGLPNRVLLADRLQQGRIQAQRRSKILAVVYLDLDGFKAVNDAHGHEVGDLLLVALATSMKQALREGDTLARIGGDEFVALLIDLGDRQASVPMLKRLLAAAAGPVQHGGLMLQLSVSLGVTFYPQVDEVDADQLLHQADQAMYQAKQAGKNRYHFFDAEHDRACAPPA